VARCPPTVKSYCYATPHKLETVIAVKPAEPPTRVMAVGRRPHPGTKKISPDVKPKSKRTKPAGKARGKTTRPPKRDQTKQP